MQCRHLECLLQVIEEKHPWWQYSVWPTCQGCLHSQVTALPCHGWPAGKKFLSCGALCVCMCQTPPRPTVAKHQSCKLPGKQSKLKCRCKAKFVSHKLGLVWFSGENTDILLLVGFMLSCTNCNNKTRGTFPVSRAPWRALISCLACVYFAHGVVSWVKAVLLGFCARTHLAEMGFFLLCEAFRVGIVSMWSAPLECGRSETDSGRHSAIST